MKVEEAEKRVRETISEIREGFKNKKWCQWADEWLSGADRTAPSAESIANEMARHRTKATAAGRAPSRSAMLKVPAENAALAAAIVARNLSDEIDPFASLMLEGYLKKDEPSAGGKKKDGRVAHE